MGAFRLSTVSTALAGSLIYSKSRPFLLLKQERAAILILCTTRSYQTESPPPNSGSISEDDHYQTLNIKENATRKEIKLSYYKLSKQFHPDVNTEEGAEGRFKKIQQAYDVLGDVKSKAEYDESRRYGGQYTSDEKSGGGFARREYKSRTQSGGGGRAGSGSTSTFDYDEHFREHYETRKEYRNTPRRVFVAGTKHSPEDLKHYWERKENELNTHDISESRGKFKVIAGLVLCTLACATFYKLVEEALRKEHQFEVTKAAANKPTATNIVKK